MRLHGGALEEGKWLEEASQEKISQDVAMADGLSSQKDSLDTMGNLESSIGRADAIAVSSEKSAATP